MEIRWAEREEDGYGYVTVKEKSDSIRVSVLCQYWSPGGYCLW